MWGKRIFFVFFLILGSGLISRAYALDVISFETEDLSKWGSYTEEKNIKTRINYIKDKDEKYGDILKINYLMDSGSWCGVYRHSLDQNWSGAQSVKLVIRGTEGAKARFSFQDKHHVSYVQDLAMTTGWKELLLPIGRFKKNPYYQPPEAEKGQDLNLAKVYQIQIEPQTAGNGVIYWAKVEAVGATAILNSGPVGINKISTASPIMFENFESGKIVSDFQYANEQGGASITLTVKKRDKTSNNKNQYYLRTLFNSGNGVYGCGFGFGSSSSFKEGDEAGSLFNAKGRTVLKFFGRSGVNIKFAVSINESKETDGEKWTSPVQVGSGNWMPYEIPLKNFRKNQNSGNQTGNGVFEIEAIKNLEFEILPNQGINSLFLDDISFL